jgi:hypothetical protein
MVEKYQFNIVDVDGMDKLKKRMSEANDAEDWSHILRDYISFGNSKISKKVAIFNMNSATDCPNIGTDHCQVPKNKCYAFQAENRYGNPLDYRRRQEYLWDNMDANLWAKAFQHVVNRMLNDVEAIRFSEAGDFRNNEDIKKVNKISKHLDGIVDVYTYSASDYLDWSLATEFTVNQSNDKREYGDRRYFAVKDGEKPDDSVWCPHDYEKRNGSDNPTKCGDCRLCIDEDGPDVAIPMH